MSEIRQDYVVGLIPARGGSKSIPLKNIATLGGRPMIDYVIKAAQACPEVNTIVCSTDHDQIAQVCQERGVRVIPRPAAMAGDQSPVIEVIRHILDQMKQELGFYPGLVVLLQPTSPFLLPEHITACVERLAAEPKADSAQTIAPVLHNNHAFNQRVFNDGQVRFRFHEERQKAYNKQLKPKFFKFGNLVVSRAAAVLAGKDPFGDISLGVEISSPYDIDVDGPDDLEYAEFLIERGKVIL